MTASAKILGSDRVVVRFADKFIVLDMDEVNELHADLSRILGREASEKVKAADDALAEISRALDALSAQAMKLQRGLR